MENIIYLISGIASVSLIWVILLEYRIRRLLRGKAGHDLEDLMRKINDDLDFLAKSRIEIKQEIEAIRQRIRHHIRGVKTVRFNPFRDSGSNQSFATAFVNDKGDGVVISSLYSRDRVSIYAKPLESHKSEYELSEEEKMAIAASKNHNG